MSLLERLVGLIHALREAGVPVSVSETLDATRAVEAIDLVERGQLMEGLAAALVKHLSHRAVFDVLFDVWFPSAIGARSTSGPDASDEPVDGPTWRDDPVAESIREQLRLALLRPHGPQRRREIEDAARRAAAAYGRGRRQGGWYPTSAVEAITPRTLMGGLLAALLGEPGSPERTTLAEHVERARIASAFDLFEREVARETARRRDEDSGRDASTRSIPLPIERIDLNSATRQQLVELRRAVAPLARRLASRLARRRRAEARGHLDFRRTMRESLATGGVPIRIAARPRRPRKPEIVVICDLSSSVQPFAQFTLMLISALRQQFSKVRVFGFVDSLDEITSLLGPDADVADSLRRVIAEADVVRRHGRTDYGAALMTMARDHADALGPATSVLVIGDGRSNYGDPAMDDMRGIVAAVRHAYWLNPERRRSWGSGDSEALRYAEVIEMSEVRDLEQLGAFVERLTVA